jgi:hypothetical protein
MRVVSVARKISPSPWRRHKIPNKVSGHHTTQHWKTDAERRDDRRREDDSRDAIQHDAGRLTPSVGTTGVAKTSLWTPYSTTLEDWRQASGRQTSRRRVSGRHTARRRKTDSERWNDRSRKDESLDATQHDAFMSPSTNLTHHSKYGENKPRDARRHDAGSSTPSVGGQISTFLFRKLIQPNPT